MNEKKIEYEKNSYIKIYDLYDNKRQFELCDENNNTLGKAEIKYIDNLTEVLEKDIVYLVWIGIDKKFKGKGMGTEFLNHITQYCLIKGYRYLHTDTALNNKKAQKFYIRNGFVDKGLTRSYLTTRSS